MAASPNRALLSLRAEFTDGTGRARAAVRFKAATVIVAPFWAPAMTKAEMRVFSVIGKTPVDVEGVSVNAWKVEERRQSDGQFLATWYLTDASPYMVA